MPEQLSAEVHQKFIADYRLELPHYVTYADALRRVLEEACKSAIPSAMVRARSKGVASFAEKCARKWQKYKNPALDFTDLCGARVVVQTLNEVQAVREYVEANFRVVETEDIGLRLGDNEFGYRDRHYIIQLNPERALAAGFDESEIAAIGKRNAELQIRTWAQHTWAETLHDRTYKSPVKLTTDTWRTAALLAALMEDGDKNFDRLASELDGIVTNYSSCADRKKIEEEIKFQDLLAASEPVVANRVEVDFHRARLHGVLGQHDDVITLLEPHAWIDSHLHDEVQLELGTALCRKHRGTPSSDPYVHGIQLMAAVENRLSQPQGSVVLNLRRRSGLRARAAARLGWAHEAELMGSSEAHRYHRLALELEPGNPYYLANVLGFELRGSAKADDLGSCMRPAIREALRTCEAHAEQGLELPFANFTAGRLHLLLGNSRAALHEYLRGANHCLDKNSCCGPDVIHDEVAWFHGSHFGKELPPPFQYAKDFLLVAKAAKSAPGHGKTIATGLLKPFAKIEGPVLIIAGGAASINAETLEKLRAPLTAALKNFCGTVISGGTKIGIPGLVGEIAGKMIADGTCKKFRLLGYRPKNLPEDAPADPNYEPIRIGLNTFSEAQILANWTDILAARIAPSDVRVLGIGGGEIAAIEYRMALSLGANVAVMPIPKEFGANLDAVDKLLADPQWNKFKTLLPLPFDAMTVRAFVIAGESGIDAQALDTMAAGFHERYRLGNLKKIKPDNLKLWTDLPDTYRTANREQAAYAIRILEAAGFCVRKVEGTPVVFTDFKPEEIEHMAELEHGRWNVERLRDSWRLGPRDDARKIHDCLVPWNDLQDGPNGVKRYDREGVRVFPEILATAGMEVYRR